MSSASRPSSWRWLYTASTRWNRRPLSMIASRCAANFGAYSALIFLRVSLVSVPLRLPKMRRALDSRRPAFSSATMVFSKVGAERWLTMASISRRCCAMPASKASGKCSSRIRSKRGYCNGRVLSENSGLSLDGSEWAGAAVTAPAVPGDASWAWAAVDSAPPSAMASAAASGCFIVRTSSGSRKPQGYPIVRGTVVLAAAWAAVARIQAQERANGADPWSRTDRDHPSCGRMRWGLLHGGFQPIGRGGT